MFTLPNSVFAREKPTIVIGSEVIYITYSFYVKNSDVPLKDSIYIFKYISKMCGLISKLFILDQKEMN
jgi:hypothetical protein